LDKKNHFNLDLEKYLLDDLDQTLKNNLNKNLMSDSALKAEMDQLKEDNINFFKKFPAEHFIQDINKHPAYNENNTKGPSKDIRAMLYRYKYILIPSISTAAFIFILFFSNILKPEIHDIKPAYVVSQNNAVRLKGPASYLRIYRKGAGANEQMDNNSHVKKNDIIQICYFSTKKYGIIFSIDSHKSVSLHYPDNQKDAAVLDMNRLSILNFSYKLDNASFERFFFVTSDQKFNIDAVLKSVESITGDRMKSKDLALDLPTELTQYSIILVQ
jgi:hypothetical protein